MNIIIDVYKSPFHILEDELDRIYSFCLHHYPREVITCDDPPTKLGSRAEVIPIDEFLGCYSPDKQEIIIFKKGIQEAIDILHVDPKDLKFIVRIHEWAHALLHLGVTENDRLKILKDDTYWPVVLDPSTKIFKEIEHNLHELLAQILTLNCIQNLVKNATTEKGKLVLERIEDTFHKLSKYQPNEYRINDDLLNIPKDRIRKSIQLLRNGWLVGKTEVWKTVLTW